MRIPTSAILATLSVLVLGSGPALATDPTPAAATSPTVAAATSPTVAAAKQAKVIDGDTVVCKSIAQTGTRFPKKVCLTKAEWFYEHTAAMDALRDKHELDPHY